MKTPNRAGAETLHVALKKKLLGDWTLGDLGLKALFFSSKGCPHGLSQPPVTSVKENLMPSSGKSGNYTGCTVCTCRQNTHTHKIQR